jgi:hypothetical protein
MAVMLSKTYAAFKAANVPDETARAAAEELAGFENRFARIETDLTLLKWMVGTHIALTLTGFGFGLSWLAKLLPPH